MTEPQTDPNLAPPAIGPVAGGEPRPLWSVMIPTFNCAKYLAQTLESVLANGIGEAEMQIEVVDDCSAKDDPEAVVREIGKGRVKFYRKPKNEGATANFNTCIQRSRGHLVHILHGDDYVLPGFYGKLAEAANKHPEVAGFFTRCQVVDERGELDRITGRIPQLAPPSRQPGDLLYSNEICTPGAVIRRSFYERYGGFLPVLVHTADWEMWVRAICDGGGYWINDLLAAYRFFPNNDTGRLARTAENLADCLRFAKIAGTRVPGFDARIFRAMVASRAIFQEGQFIALGDRAAALANRNLWRELVPFSQRLKHSVRSNLSKLVRRPR